MDFTEDSLAQKRLQRLQEVERMEALAMGKAVPSSNVLVLDTSLHSTSRDATPTRKNTRRTIHRSMTSKSDSIVNDRRPSDTEIRSLWRLKVMQME